MPQEQRTSMYQELFQFPPGRAGYYGPFGGAFIPEMLHETIDELQAAFLRVKLKKLDEWNQRRKAVAECYQKALPKTPDLILPFVPEWAEPVWHLYVVKNPHRDSFQQKLTDRARRGS